MKKRLLLIFICLIVYGQLVSQNDYYYSANKKIFMTNTENKYVIGVYDSLDFKILSKVAENIIPLFLQSYIVTLKDTIFAKQTLSHFDRRKIPVKTIGDVEIIFTGEVLLKPKTEYGIQPIIAFSNGTLSIKESTAYNTYVMNVSNWDSLFYISNKVYESGMVEYCHPNFIVPVDLNYDPLYESQYYLNNSNNIDINAPDAWLLANNATNIKIAVIDEGVEEHEDLVNKVLPGMTVSYSNDRPNTYGHPCSVAQPTSCWHTSVFAHGEACAGIIAADHNNNKGIKGVINNAQIVPINIFNNWYIEDYQSYFCYIRYRETVNDYANAINAAWNTFGCDVLNNSWTCHGTDYSNIPYADNLIDAIHNATTYGRNGKGSIVVFGSGNDNQDYSGVSFPANVAGVIAVGAINANTGIIQNYSGRGPELSLVAPSGTNTNDLVTCDRMGSLGYNTENNGHYTNEFGGTSAACPQVAGAAALMLSVNPNLTSQEVTTILQTTARDLGTPGFDNTYGYGLVDAHRAVLKAAFNTVYGNPDLSFCDVQTFTVQNTYNGTISDVTYTWTCSENLHILSVSNTASVQVKGSGIGSGWLKCTVYHLGDSVSSEKQVNVIYNSSETLYDNNTITSNTIWSNTCTINGEISVEPLSTLTISGTVHSTSSARIVVRPGGKLIVDGGVLTSACTGEMWQGIFVEGHSNLHQTAASQGTVELKNGAVVENALCGIRTGAPGDTSTAFTGGIITAENATFHNCTRAVYMRPYTYYNPATGILLPNASSFTRCTFSEDNGYLGLTGAEEQVRLWGVAGVRFGGCTFTCTTSPMNTSRNYGINAEDAGFRVDTYCSQEIMNSDCSCPGQYATHSSFSGFYKAVNANTSGSPFAVTVDEVSFSNNQTGVSVSGNNHATITRCQFDLSTAPETTYPATGLELSACTGFLVEGNSFSRSSSTFPTYGIKAAGTGISSNSLYRNTFSGLSYGIHTSGNNGGSFSGLRFSCNTFSQNTHDIYVAGGEVAEAQGSTSVGADNSFSSGATGNFEVMNPRFQLDYYYSTGNSHCPTVHTNNVLLHSNASANGCASTLCTGGGFIRGLSEYTALSGAVNAASAVCQDADDTANRVSIMQEMSGIANGNIRGIIGGDTIDVDVLRDWFSAISETWSKYSLAETEFLSGENNVQTLQGISALLTTSEERDEYDNYMAFNALKEALSGAIPGHANWPAASGTQIEELQRIAEANTSRASVMARGVLCFFFGICYDDDEEVTTETRRAAAKDGEGYLPVLINDTITFSIAYTIATYIKDHNPWYLGAKSYYYVSCAADITSYNNTDYRFFGLNYGNGTQTPYLREDTLTGRIFRYFPETDTEVMTCDMSLTEGDTFYLPSFHNQWYWELQQQYIVVDSVTYINDRKTIWFPPIEIGSIESFFGTEGHTYPLCFIEGVGPTYGPFGLEARSGVDRKLGLLLCVHHNDSLVYMTDPVLGCEQLVTSVPEYPDVSMKIYPNPTRNTLHVEFEGTDDLQGTITVTDITGVVHYVETPHCDVSTNGITIDVSNLTPGLYVVSFRNGKGVVVRKFVKL